MGFLIFILAAAHPVMCKTMDLQGNVVMAPCADPKTFKPLIRREDDMSYPRIEDRLEDEPRWT